MGGKKLLIVFIIWCLVGLIVFYFWPDIDLILLGIKYHRFFLTHSNLVPLILFFILLKAEAKVLKTILSPFLASFTTGISLHLFIDLFTKKSVNFILVNTLIYGTYQDDQAWLFLNVILGCYLIYRMYLIFKEVLA